MASRNAKAPTKNVGNKTSPAKKATTPTKKTGPTSPTKSKANGDVKPKGKATNVASPKSTPKESKSPTQKASPSNDTIDNEQFTNGVNLNGPPMDNFDQPMEGGVMIGNLQVIFLTETETKYINTKHQPVTTRPGDSSCDVTLEVDGKTYKAHRSVLTEESGYFKDKLKSSRSDPVKIEEDIGAEPFEILLDSLYDGYVVLSPDMCQGFFDTAAILDVHWLMDAGADNLMRMIGPENYQIIGRLFEKHNMDSLKQETHKLMAHNLVMFSESNAFLENLDFEVLKDILSNNQYVEGSEGFIVKVVLDWVSMDKDNRQQHLKDLVNMIRYPLLEPEELNGLPREVTNFREVAKEIEEATTYGVNLSGQSLYSGEKYYGRGYREVVALVSASELNNGNLILYKDLNKIHEPICVEHLEPAGLKTELTFTYQTSLGNFLYAAGGQSEDFGSSPRMFRFDPRYREWMELSPMNHSRLSFALCSSDKNLFAIGGIERTVEEGKETESALSSVEMYSPADNSWKELPSLPFGSSEHAAAFCDGKVYVTGGISSNPLDPVPLDYMNALQVDGGETWQSLTPMFTGRQGHSLSAVNGKLFVLGGKCGGGIGIQGFENCLSTEVYDPAAKQWSKLRSLPEGVGSVSRFVSVLGAKIVFLAGQHWHYYDSENDEFIEGDFCGPEVQRVVSLRVAYPPTI